MPTPLGDVNSTTQVLTDSDIGGDVAASRNNYVLVKAKSDLPTPSAGVITLADNTSYEINGTIALGTDRIVCGVSNIIYGIDKSDDIITYTGTASDMITSTNEDLTVRNITLVSSGTTSNIFNITGDGTNRVELAELILANSVSLGTIGGGMATIVFRNNLITGNSGGLSFAGNNDDTFITDNLFEAFTGTPTFVDIATGTYHTIIISRNMWEVDSGQTGLNIGTITFIGGGLIEANSFEDAGTYLAGIDASDTEWRQAPQSNIGIAGLYKDVFPSIKSSWSTTGTTMIEITGEETLFIGKADAYQDDATSFKAFIEVEVTHDQTGEQVAFEMYNTTDNVPMGFGGNTQGDVDAITWQSGTTVRYTFLGTPDFSDIRVGNFMTISGATNAVNDGTYEITAVNDGSDWIEITNPARTSSTGDETSSPAVAHTGSVFYATIAAANVYQNEITPIFELDPSKEYSIRVRRASSGGGNPSAYIRRGTTTIENF
jgi:hypothetical protein